MACMVFLWDFTLTFGMEVDLVWKSKWNFMKGLYLFQRYLPFTEAIWLPLYRKSDVFPIFLTFIFFLGQILRETGCQAVFYANGG